MWLRVDIRWIDSHFEGNEWWKITLQVHISQALIKFIPKTGGLEIIISWCQITLLSMSYKILARALTLLAPILDYILLFMRIVFFL